MSTDVRQVIVVHGGDTFPSVQKFQESLRTRTVTVDSFRPRQDWKSTLQQTLGPSFDVLLPRMPCKENASYDEWSIWFEKLIPFIAPNVILVGHSLGGIFLAKYLSTHRFSVTIATLILVAAPYSSPDLGSFHITSPVVMDGQKVMHTTLFHSTDDPVVPYEDALRYKNDIPTATLYTFHDRGHFNQSSFPELVANIINVKS